MKKILEFNCPLEDETWEVYNAAPRLAEVINRYAELLRSKRKYGMDADQATRWDAVENDFWELCQSCDIDPFSL